MAVAQMKATDVRAEITFDGHDNPEATLLLSRGRRNQTHRIDLDVAREILVQSSEIPAYEDALDDYDDIARVEGTPQGCKNYPIDVDAEIAIRIAGLAPRQISLQTSDFERACAAWFRRCTKTGTVADLPGRTDSHLLLTEHGNYVVLANGHRTLAVFEIVEDDKLGRVDKWPVEVESATS